MKCNNCGNENSDGSRFCMYCGAVLVPTAVPTPEAVTTNAPAAVPPLERAATNAPVAPQVSAPQPQPQPAPAPAATNAPVAPQVSAPQPQPQPQPAPAPARTNAPAPQVSAPKPQPQPQPKPQPQQRTQPQPQPKQRAFRDGRGKYIVKRLIFFICAVVVWILFTFLCKGLQMFGGAPAMAGIVFNRLPTTFLLIVIPLIIAFVISMLIGLIRGSTGKKVIRIIAAFLRALVPFVLFFLLVYPLAINGGLLPVYGGMSGASMVMPLLCLTIPLLGYMMNAAVSNGHKAGFGGSVGAVAAWMADHIIICMAMVAITETFFSLPGVFHFSVNSLMSMNFGSDFATAMILICIITYLIKFIMDVIASLASGGDPSEQVYAGREPGEKDGKALILIGLILAALVVIAAIVLPFTGRFVPYEMDPNGCFLDPGMQGHILGTDQLGRDFYAMLTCGLRNTMLAALVNTIIACVLGIVFGLAIGFIRNAAAEIFKGIRYIFGYGAPLTLLIFLSMGIFFRSGALVLFVLVGMYSWGGISDRVANAIRAGRDPMAPAKKARILPILEQVVRTFCTCVISISALSILGFGDGSLRFVTLGTVLSQARNYLGGGAPIGLYAAIVTAVLLIAFYLLQAGLATREKYTYNH